ncbi:hypothetical protein AGMMS49574_12390 [Bacteroidia bacterium]|nr:hypothetical protein AGMMS49574_12390 [Bacteroidia bacterium]
MKDKKVSIVMCTYNGAKYIRQQLDSIVNQSYPIYELIVQDDCSTDNTFSILQEYADKYVFISLYRNEKQKGINENFFSAMERATGDYVVVSDQDDVCDLNKIENQLNAIEDNWLCGGFSKPFSEKKTVEFDIRIPNFKIERLIHVASAISGHTMMIKRDLIPQVLRYRSFPTILYDHLFLIISGSYNKITFVEKVLVNYREHEESATFTTPVMKRGEGNKNIKNIIRSFFRTLFLYIELRNKMQTYFLSMYKLLESLPEKGSVKADAQRISLYQSQKGLIAYIKLTCIYLKVRKNLFHVPEKKSFFSILRAIYFPISCSDYFRFMSKSYQKR